VSPEAEAARLASRSGDESESAYVKVLPKWPEPFAQLFRYGGGDVLFQHAALNTVVNHRTKRGDQELIFRVGEAVRQTEMPTSHAAWFARLFGDSDLLVELKALRTARVPVTRIDGWPGYFWWELQQDRIEQRSLRRCSQCGRLLRGGRSDKQFCTREENPRCYCEHNTTIQRRSRARKRVSSRPGT
jgi:hypothetical protein